MFRGVSEAATKQAHPPGDTDLTRWSLEVQEGRQVWRYLGEDEDAAAQANVRASRYHVGLPASADSASVGAANTLGDCLSQSIGFFAALQTDDGHWAGDYGGPMFLLPGYAIVMHITGTPIPEPNRLEMIRYLSNMQTSDGGWGIHIESLPTVLGTALNYTALRLLGVGRNDARVERARAWLESRGGCLGIPSWGKFWLAVLNVYQWEGVHSLFPEMVLLPQWFPLHTHRMWSYCRTVYMPMTFLYGCKFQGPVTDLVKELREELVPGDYAEVDWPAAKSFVREEDLYTPHTVVLETFFKAVNLYEYVAPTWLRRRALDWIYRVLEKEDEFTNFICIVNKMINMLCVFAREGPDCDKFHAHVERIPDYFWMGRDGMKMNGTNGSQLWDTAFMVQALIESGLQDKFQDVFRKANEFIDVSQIKVDHPDHKRYYRDETKGGWPFSTRDIGWVVADCTGEGLKGALICKEHRLTPAPLADERLFDAVNILLLMQNATGGYATCEKTRGWRFFELFNASEVFGEIMIDYDYVECTSSALQALCHFRAMYPHHRAREVQRAIDRGTRFMLSIQLPDGSWEGMWGICFTYGTWFGVEGLMDAGCSPADDCIQRACAFLVSTQKDDGGWGETFMSCVTRTYVQHPESQVVNTAWAVLTLLKAKYHDQRVIRRGVDLLLRRRQPDGDWAQESISGVFNKNCMINYSNYKNIFPIWALGRYMQAYPADTRA